MTDRFAHVEAVARALLYEGVVLYPYRRSSTKNQQRFPFGVLAPRAYADAMGEGERWRARAEVLVDAGDDARLDVEVRCLQHASGDAGPGEAKELRLSMPTTRLPQLREAPLSIHHAEAAGVDDRGRRYLGLSLHVEVSVERLERRLHRVAVEVRNLTPVELDPQTARGRPARTTRQAMVHLSTASTHVLLGLADPSGPAFFLSLLEPPPELEGHAAECRSEGVHPVLVGPRSARGASATVLASPVIVYDHPQLAPESPGDFFDGTEVDELLALRVLTLSEREKAELRDQGGPAAALLARVEAMGPDELSQLHGRLRKRAPSSVRAAGASVVVGDHVRLRPRAGGDAMDIALAGRLATIVSIEQDVDGQLLVGVTVDDDPGRDLGLVGWPGHRFFYRPEELERIGT